MCIHVHVHVHVHVCGMCKWHVHGVCMCKCMCKVHAAADLVHVCAWRLRRACSVTPQSSSISFAGSDDGASSPYLALARS